MPDKHKGLRSENNHKILVIPWTKNKTFTARTFLAYGPLLWNRLPNYLDLRLIDKNDDFKCQLKTHLFDCC